MPKKNEITTNTNNSSVTSTPNGNGATTVINSTFSLLNAIPAQTYQEHLAEMYDCFLADNMADDRDLRVKVTSSFANLSKFLKGIEGVSFPELLTSKSV